MGTASFDVGDLHITLVSDGHLRLDGGAMFGVVPKTIWQKRLPPDDVNRISIGLISALVRTPAEVVLIETGVGDQFDPKAREIYGIDHDDRLLAALAREGLATADISKVIFSHLHFDHVGNATRRNDQGELIPTFENAEYIVQRSEWEAAVAPTLRNKASYLGNLFLPIEAAGQLHLVEGDGEITPGIRSVLTGGHSHGHQVLFLESSGAGAVFWGDLIPTSAHVDYPFIMAYDLWPLDTLKYKQRLIPHVIENNYACIWTHESTCRWGRIKLRPDGKQHTVDWG